MLEKRCCLSTENFLDLRTCGLHCHDFLAAIKRKKRES
jgi:hypothetical protein